MSYLDSPCHARTEPKPHPGFRAIQPIPFDLFPAPQEAAKTDSQKENILRQLTSDRSPKEDAPSPLRVSVLTPKKYYPFTRKKDGRITADFTPSAREKKRCTYKLKDTETGASYIGKTGQGLAKRGYGHHYGINHPESDAGQSELYDDIREHPERFQIGIQLDADELLSSDLPIEVILEGVGEGEEGEIAIQLEGATLEDLETICIIANDSVVKGYNKNYGGGGGSALESEPRTPPRTPVLAKEEVKTPCKSYALDYNEKGKIRVLLTPGAKKTRSFVYGFRHEETREWLIGESEQTVPDRLKGYHFAFDHAEKDVGKRPLPQAVREEPEAFRFYILHHGANPKGMEKAFIKAKEAFTEGFNQNRGGGGSSGSKYRKLVVQSDSGQ